MTPNPNPSPELLPMSEAPKDGSYIVGYYRALDSERTKHWDGRPFVIRHEGQTVSDYDLGWGLFPGWGGVPDICFSGWAPLPAALSPQTLPAPGEVDLRETIGRELIGWDNQMSPEAIAHPNNAAFFAHWLDVTDPNDGEQAKHYHAGIDMILRLTPTLATVAAANDEGVARIIAREAVDIITDLIGPQAAQSGTNCRVVEDHLRQVARALATSRSQHEGASS